MSLQHDFFFLLNKIDFHKDQFFYNQNKYFVAQKENQTELIARYDPERRVYDSMRKISSFLPENYDVTLRVRLTKLKILSYGRK